MKKIFQLKMEPEQQQIEINRREKASSGSVVPKVNAFHILFDSMKNNLPNENGHPTNVLLTSLARLHRGKHELSSTLFIPIIFPWFFF